MLLGYLRVSTTDQTVHLQHDALERAGVTTMFSDNGVSGTVDPLRREGFCRLLDHARAGDEIVAWRIDRVGRNAAAVLSLVHTLDERQITLRTISDGISTHGTTGRLVLAILAAVAQMDVEVLRERVTLGVHAARERGIRLGRPPGLNHDQRALATTLRDQGKSYAQIARTLNAGKSTIARLMTTPPTPQLSHTEGRHPDDNPHSDTPQTEPVLTHRKSCPDWAGATDPTPKSFPGHHRHPPIPMVRR